ncbi:MAG: hypothetical protein JNM97_15290 [Rhodoferax sp.]|jgi:hypothetical protein|nr:hypothetical protein [Rhodoferax sp.]
MKIDTTEIAALAQAQADARVDLYGVIHKALRAMMAETLVAVGRLDGRDAAACAHTGEQVRNLLDFCSSHILHENLWVHTAIEARATGASARIAQEHGQHEQHIAALRATLEALLQARSDVPRAVSAARLYRELALFIADNLVHMHAEETTHNALLWARYSDAELLALHAALVGSIPPDEMATTLRWMLPAMNPQERCAMLADLRDNAPPEAFQGTLDIAQAHLDGAGWTLLARELGLPPAAGLVTA